MIKTHDGGVIGVPTIKTHDGGALGGPVAGHDSKRRGHGSRGRGHEIERRGHWRFESHSSRERENRRAAEKMEVDFEDRDYLRKLFGRRG